MKRLALLFISFWLFCGWMPVHMIGGNIPHWHDGAAWYCGWETGTGETNASASGGEGTFSGTGGGLNDDRNTSTPLEGIADYKNEVVASDATSYVYYTVADKTTIAVRMRINLITNGLTTGGNNAYFAAFMDGSSIIMLARFYYSGTALSVNVRHRRAPPNESTTEITGAVINISAATEYQFEMVYIASTHCQWKLYDATGTQVGSTQTNSTDYLTTAQIDSVRIGTMNAVLSADDSAYQIDNVYISYIGLPGPEIGG